MHQMSRRSLIGAVGAAGAALPALAQEAPSAGGRIIDVHHHFIAPAYLQAKRAEVEAMNTGHLDTLKSRTPEKSLEHLDKTGARGAMLSPGGMTLWFGDDNEGRRLSRITNDFGAQIVRDHPTRFGLLAGLPWPDVDGSLREIEYAFDVLKADGVAFVTSYANHYPGEPRYLPIWQELNRRKALVYFHPTSPACCADIVQGVAPATLEFPFDSTRAIASLLTNLVFSKQTDLTFLFSHGGGALPMLAQRLAASFSGRPDLVAQMRGGAMAELRRLNFDTASVANPMSWAALTRLAPTTQILFGTDYPFGSIATVDAELQALGMPAEDLQRVRYGNANRMLPRFPA